MKPFAASRDRGPVTSIGWLPRRTGAVTRQGLLAARVDSSNQVGLVRQGRVAYRVHAVVPARACTTRSAECGAAIAPCVRRV